MGVDTVDFIAYSDVAKRIKELVPDGLDVAIDAATSHEPKTVIHKISKALSLETDASETLNETFLAVKKMGRVGIISAYAGYTHGLNMGAVMEKGIRLIGNGQGKSKSLPRQLETILNRSNACLAPVHLYWNEILEDYIIPGKFDPTFMVTHRVPLEDMAKLYRAFDRRELGVIKVFVETKASSPPMPGCPQTNRVDDWGHDPGVSRTGDQ